VFPVLGALQERSRARSVLTLIYRASRLILDSLSRVLFLSLHPRLSPPSSRLKVLAAVLAFSRTHVSDWFFFSFSTMLPPLPPPFFVPAGIPAGRAVLPKIFYRTLLSRQDNCPSVQLANFSAFLVLSCRQTVMVDSLEHDFALWPIILSRMTRLLEFGVWPLPFSRGDRFPFVREWKF